MRYDIKRGAAVVASQLYLEGSVTERIMGEEIANITFSNASKIEFHIGDKITIYGKDYFLSADPVTVKKNSREFRYTLIFFSIKYSLSDTQLFFYDNENLLTLPDFSIMGNAETCLDIVLANINRVGGGWTKGVVDETEVKNVSFSDSKCLEAISKIAEEFKLEYWIDSDKSIHFTERKPVSGYSFEYGKAKGLKDITRSVLEGGSLVTRLYVKGAETNLPKNYRDGQKNLRIDVPYLEKNIDIYGTKEHIETFSDIYPKRVGTVTAVDPADPNRFTDADLDFDLNAYNEYGTTVLMNGVAAKIIFQTGQLAGYRIELIEAGGFNSATKTFYLNAVKDEKDLQIPSELMRPAIGDKYIIEDIMMPNAYVLLAESELKIKGQEYLDQNSKERFQYALESDILYFRNQNVNIQLGATANFKDSDFNLDDDIRVTSLQKNIQNPFDVKFDLSEVTQVSSIVQSYYEQKEQTASIVNSIKYNAELARRNYLFGREFHEKVFDGEGYFDAENIKPLSIETKMISLGSRLQQFGLPGVNFTIQNNNALQNTAGKIAHQTIDPDAIREWIIPSNSVIGINNNFNYIYIKCQKVGVNANFVVTEAQIKVEQDADFYHFEVGYLSSVIDGYRKIKTTYGFAQLNPAELSIGRISDPTGNNHIDLLTDKIAIKAKVEFTSDSPAIEQVNSQIVIGGRNLVSKSKKFIDSNNLWVRDILLTENLIVGKQYTVSIISAIQVSGNHFKIRNRDGSLVTFIELSESLGGGKRIFKTSFIATKSTNDLILFSNPNNGSYYQFESVKIEKGNKTTDWTPAPEDVTEQINEAEAVANTANLLLEDIASDNKLTPGEKQLLKKEYDLIIAEKPNLTNQATTYGVSTTVYTSAYNEVVIYTNPLLVNLSTTVDIIGSVLRSTFNTYYTAKVNLLKVITDKVSADFTLVYGAIEVAQNTANNAINQIDDIGSDNKLTPSEKQIIVNEWNRIKSEYSQNYSAALSLGVSVTSYQSSYNDLNSYISPLMANLMTTSTIVGDAFRTNFKNYYNASVAIVKLITDKQIADIQIGGRNLIKNSKVFIDSNSNWVRDFALTENLIVNEEYVVSVISVVQIGGSSFRLADRLGNTVATLIPTKSIGGGKNLFTATFKALKATNDLLLFTNPNNGSWYQFESAKIEKGNKSTDYTPAPEDVDTAIATSNVTSANALAQARNAQATASSTASVTSFLQTTAEGGVVSTGTLQVGSANGSANAGITGVVDRGGNSVRIWAGATYAGKNTANWLMREDGVEEQWFNGVLVRQRGVINGAYVEVWYNLNGQIGKQITFSSDGKILEEWYNEGVLVYQIGQNGIYYVADIPESFAYKGLVDCNVNLIHPNLEFLEAPIRQMMYQKTNDPRRFELRANKNSYLYNAGQNVYSEGNKQYDGFKNSKSKTDNVANRWYAYEILGFMLDDGADSTRRFANVFRTENGKIVQSGIVTVETSGYTFNQF